jgi:hypothetical protein
MRDNTSRRKITFTTQAQKIEGLISMVQIRRLFINISNPSSVVGMLEGKMSTRMMYNSEDPDL